MNYNVSNRGSEYLPNLETDLMVMMSYVCTTRAQSESCAHGSKGSYDTVTRTHSCRSLHRHDDLDDGIHGAYRTLKVTG